MFSICTITNNKNKVKFVQVIRACCDGKSIHIIHKILYFPFQHVTFFLYILFYGPILKILYLNSISFYFYHLDKSITHSICINFEQALSPTEQNQKKKKKKIGKSEKGDKKINKFYQFKRAYISIKNEYFICTK